MTYTPFQYGPSVIREQVVEAFDKDRAVFFIGSGLSIKAGYPCHTRLVNDILTECGKSRTFNNNLEQLQVLENMGINVHVIAYDLLSKYTVRPNCTDVQECILRIFKNPSSIKIVTTNYDSLLEIACVGLKDEVISNTTHFPGSPTHMNGIYHIHGSIEGKPEDLVITQQDYIRTYERDGVTKAFLKGIFKTHTALFIGYGLEEEPIKSYLAAVNIDFPKLDHSFFRAVDTSASDMTGQTNEVEIAEPDFRKSHLGVKEIRFAKSNTKSDPYYRLKELLYGFRDHMQGVYSRSLTVGGSK